MKRTLLIISALLLNISVLAQVPDWVKSRPVSDSEYIGIGMCPISDPDYMKKATQNALADISSQISLIVDNKSFYHIIDIDNKSREMLEDKISSSMTAWLEGQKLVDACTYDNVYYVYYSLNKNLYSVNAEKKRSNVIHTGWNYLENGKKAEENMQLLQAAQLYAKGLQAVEPWIFMDLIHIQDGYETNVPVELYNSYIKIFSGLAITTNTVQVEGEAFKPVAAPIAGCLSKDGSVVPNIKLKAEFISGGGVISKPIETDYNGTAEFYITNITSKEPVQEVRISIDDSVFESLPSSYNQMLKNKDLPSAKITVVLKSAPVVCYFNISSDNDLEGIENRVSSLLTNNYFTFTEDKDEAQYYIELSSKLDMGNVVTGGAYNMNSCYCSLVIKIYDNNTHALLVNYSVNSAKVLSPVHYSAGETISMCVREVMKRVNRELPGHIKKLNVN